MSDRPLEMRGRLDAACPPPGSTTEHTLLLPDAPIRYRAIADWITLRRLNSPVAHVFHVAYLSQDADAPRRPLTFVFNGGPGAASAYLHFGAMGPRRVAFGEAGRLPPSPARLLDNMESWLSFTDLVFVDPVGTGFSRAVASDRSESVADGRLRAADGRPRAEAEAKENPEFWDVDKDLESLADFITQFLCLHHRWLSPLFLAGESYGGFRSARLSRRIQEEGVGVCGVLLISPGIELDSLSGSDYDLSHWIDLFPSLVAAAHHHGRVRNMPSGTTVCTLLQEAESFAVNDLARWLAQGDGLANEERSRMCERMAELCGLSPAMLERANGRISARFFCHLLLQDERRVCSRFDASLTAVNPFPNRDPDDSIDPTRFAAERVFASAANHYVRDVLGVESAMEYRLFTARVNKGWKQRGRDHAFRKVPGALDDLRYAMCSNEHTNVLIAHGELDLVTPYFSTDRLVRLMKLTPEQRQRVAVRRYRGGHMFYTWDESRRRLASAAEAFVAASGAGTPLDAPAQA